VISLSCINRLALLTLERRRICGPQILLENINAYNMIQTGNLQDREKILEKFLPPWLALRLVWNIFSQSPSMQKKLPAEEYSAFAPFWSDRPKKVETTKFEDLDCYATEAGAVGKTWQVLFLVNPSNSLPCGFVAKPLNEDTDGSMQVKVFVFSDFVSDGTGVVVAEQRNPNLEIDAAEFLNKRVRYVS